MTPLILLLLAQAPEFDLLISGGRVADGSGNPWYHADIGIRGGRIAAIGRLSGRAARREIRAGGMMVSPGFIDMMGGSSAPLFDDPATAASKIRQGITTMMAGEGGSEAPSRRWRTFGEYFPELEKKGLRLNVVHNVGAAQVRRMVIGEEDRAPTAPEMEAMKRHVDQAMRDGAVGLSTALIYPPGTFAKKEELIELVKVVGRYGGFYSTHMRNESSQLLDAIRESIEIGERGGVPVHVYHLKAAGEANWPLMRQAIRLIAEARTRGLDVTADIYPYIRNGLGLGSFIPPRHYAHGADPLRKSLADPKIRAALRSEIETDGSWENWFHHVGRDWDNVLVAQAARAEDKRFEGKSVAEIAKLRGTDAWTTFFDLVAQADVSVNPKSMNEDQKHQALRSPFVSFCTDASPTAITATGAHPRAFGSFPRILAKYVREEKIIPIEEAIRKMTSLAANRLGLLDRGRIAPGMAADLVVFDPGRVQDTATFTRPLAFPEGIPYVLVNGKIAVDRDQPGDAAGMVLRRR